MDILTAATTAISPFNILLALCGTVLGTFIGALPGLSATMALSVLLPFTFTMEPSSALIALGAIYTGAIYGGAYSAILVNTPGTPAAIATSLDGFPMAKKGDGDLAVTLSCLASVFGGLTGALFLLFFAPPLAEIALAFGPVEYFWLSMFGLSLIAALSKGNTLKGLAGGGLGLLLATSGSAVVGGDVRFTFDQPALLGGIHIIPAMIGLFCVPVVIDMIGSPDPHIPSDVKSGVGLRFVEALRLVGNRFVNLVRSSVIGSIIGILPAAGGSVAGLISYTAARRASRDPDSFGKGAPDGVVASEAANSATVGGGFVPTLVLGIPGTPPDAVILGALMVQGIKTGPSLFTQQSDIVYTFIFGLMLATLLMLPTGLLIGRYAFKTIVTIPKPLLTASIALLIVVGTYAVETNVVHVYMMVALGVAGWILLRAGFEPSPIVLGIILGPIAEQGFVQAWLIGSSSGNLMGMYFGRPLSLLIIALIALTLIGPMFAKWKAKRVIPERQE